MYRPALELTMHSVRDALAAGLAAIAQGQESIDLSQVDVVDSAAVATLLAWQRAAAEAGRPLQFTHAPDTLLTLARLYGLDGLLHFTSHRHPVGA